MLQQLSPTACGPTVLHAVYKHHLKESPPLLGDVCHVVPELATGGTLDALLGIDALRREFNAELYSWGNQVYGPTWFDQRGQPKTDFAERLRRRCEAQAKGSKAAQVHQAHREFVSAGGLVVQRQFSAPLLRELLCRGPIIASVSGTHLNGDSREVASTPGQFETDDILGMPYGHFVLIHGLSSNGQWVHVLDPDHGRDSRDRKLGLSHFHSSLMLGVQTNDGSLLSIFPSS